MNGDWVRYPTLQAANLGPTPSEEYAEPYPPRIVAAVKNLVETMWPNYLAVEVAHLAGVELKAGPVVLVEDGETLRVPGDGTLTISSQYGGTAIIRGVYELTLQEEVN